MKRASLRTQLEVEQSRFGFNMILPKYCRYIIIFFNHTVKVKKTPEASSKNKAFVPLEPNLCKKYSILGLIWIFLDIYQCIIVLEHIRKAKLCAQIRGESDPFCEKNFNKIFTSSTFIYICIFVLQSFFKKSSDEFQELCNTILGSYAGTVAAFWLTIVVFPKVLKIFIFFALSVPSLRKILEKVFMLISRTKCASFLV